MYIGLLECHPVYKAKHGAIEARTRRYRRRLRRFKWQRIFNAAAARYQHDHRVVKPSTTRFK